MTIKRRRLLPSLALLLVLTLTACQSQPTSPGSKPHSPASASDSLSSSSEPSTPGSQEPSPALSQTPTAPTDDEAKASQLEALARTLNKLSYRLASSLMAEQGKASEGSQNQSISAFSLASALALAWPAANPQLQQAIQEMVGQDGVALLAALQAHQILYADPTSSTQDVSADGSEEAYVSLNSLWLNQKHAFPLQSAYEEEVKNKLKADVFQLTFPEPAQSEMGQYLKDKTHDLITAAPQLDDENLAVLMNCFYFKSSWVQAFDSNQSQEQVFTKLDGQTERAPFMRQYFPNSSVYESALGQRLDLPLMHGDLQVFLPAETAKLKPLLSNPEDLQLAFEGGEAKAYQLQLALPRFKAKGDFSLKKQAETLGAEAFFSPGASLDQLLEKASLPISDIVQASAIDVNEDGVSAAAYTAVVAECATNLPDLPLLELNFDRPFLYCLRDDAGIPLLLGLVASLTDN